MASPTPLHYSILIDEEVTTAVPVPLRHEYFTPAITSPNIPGMELPPPVTAIVTGEGQKTSSVLSRALSRIEMRIQAETIRLSDRS